MTKLNSLRSRIADLRRRRMAVRHGAGYFALALAVLWLLVGAFLIDWTFALSRLQRGLLLLAIIGVAVWAFRKYAWPWFAITENDLDVALMVERKQRIDSDLVAALQFETPEASQWGSTQLEGAVIDYVADFSRHWNIFEGFSKQDLTRRALWLSLTLAILVTGVAIRPDFARAFFNRMFLGSAHYPTRTQIESLAINGKPIDLSLGENVVVKYPYGQPLKFEVRSGGEVPANGKIGFRSASGDSDATIDLNKQNAPAPGVLFQGELPKLVDSVYTEVRLGDAWTDPLLVQMVALPVIDTKLTPIPPPYARGTEEAAAAPGAHQLAVIEGSQVALEVVCANKRLRLATLKINDQSFPLQESSGSKPGEHVWRLVSADSPLRRVTKPLRWQLSAVDEDGLAPETPVTGSIRIKADGRPRITGDVVTHFVLPSGTPKIEYRASDDYGIKELSILLETIGGKASAATPAVVTRQLRKIAAGQWIGRDEMPIKDAYTLNLKSLNLQKGDQLRATLQVVDYRGEGEGQLAQSEPIVFQVTDESGVLAAISESDERSVHQLDAIIQRQLGVGGTR